MAGNDMEQAVRALFAQYERFFAAALAGGPDPEMIAALYAPEFIAASPVGVKAGRNDDALIAAMAQGYAYYREIGTRSMSIRDLRISAIDECHCIAHIGWRALYARDDLPRTEIDFDVHYLVQYLGGAARIFGWISGDEQAVLKRHGIT